MSRIVTRLFLSTILICSLFNTYLRSVPHHESGGARDISCSELLQEEKLNAYKAGQDCMRLVLRIISHISKGTLFNNMDKLAAENVSTYGIYAKLAAKYEAAELQHEYAKGLINILVETHLDTFFKENNFTKTQEDIIRQFHGYFKDIAKKMYSTNFDSWEHYYRATKTKRKVFITELEEKLKKSMPAFYSFFINPGGRGYGALLANGQGFYTFKSNEEAIKKGAIFADKVLTILSSIGNGTFFEKMDDIIQQGHAIGIGASLSKNERVPAFSQGLCQRLQALDLDQFAVEARFTALQAALFKKVVNFVSAELVAFASLNPDMLNTYVADRQPYYSAFLDEVENDFWRIMPGFQAAVIKDGECFI